MDESKLFIEKHDAFMMVVAEGNVMALKECIRKYKESGRYKKEADFSPVLRRSSPQQDFMAVNIYGKRFCTLTAMQHHSYKPNTSLVCSGIKGLPLEFLIDFADIIQFDPQNPSAELIRTSKISQRLFLDLYQELSKKGEDLAAKLMSLSLRSTQEKYSIDARVKASPFN